MRLDPIIQRRFEELRIKAEVIAAAKIHDFTSSQGVPYFKVPSAQYKEWATNVLNLLGRTFGEDTPHYQHFSQHYASFEGWISQFEDSFGIFKAAAEDYAGGYLFNVRTLAKAEVLAGAMQQAKELLASGYKDPACILARVSLGGSAKGPGCEAWCSRDKARQDECGFVQDRRVQHGKAKADHCLG